MSDAATTWTRERHATLFSAIREAGWRLRPYLPPTRLVSASLDGSRVWFKCEHEQVTGSFKVRGALNAVLSLPATDLARGIVTASTGNHGRAVAYALHRAAASGLIYLPRNAAPAKVRALEEMGARLAREGDDGGGAERAARADAVARGLRYVSPYNDWDVVAGQGTAGRELLSQLPTLDTVYVSLGGGGLIGGIAAWVKWLAPRVRVVACVPAHSQAMLASVRAGRVVAPPELPTLSDGTAGSLDEDAITLPLCAALIDDFVVVSERDIARGMRWAHDELRTVVEGAAGLAIAGARLDPRRDRRGHPAVVLCGANVGAETMARAFDLADAA